MPINLKEIASISGMPGLYRLLKPTRSGVILESLDENRTRIMAQARHRLSLLEEISIYTTGEEETVPLNEVMDRIQERFGNDLPVTAKSSPAELQHFMEEVLPDYDQNRVYTSDMKKLVQWYLIASRYANEPETEAAAESTAAPEDASSATEQA